MFLTLKPLIFSGHKHRAYTGNLLSNSLNLMSYQLFLEYYFSGIGLTEQVIVLLDLKLYSQVKNLNVPLSPYYLEVAQEHICDSCFICKDRLWITCLATFWTS